MSELDEFITPLLSLGTIVLDVLIVFLLIVLATPYILRDKGAFRSTTAFIENNAALMGFLAALAAVLGSLFYSEVVGFPPCVLCWWQRIFLYPQIIILGIAALRKDKGVFLYTFLLSIIGMVLALYHTYLQFGGSSLGICGPGEADCSFRYFVEFGYVTIPTMSLTVFMFLAVLSAFALFPGNRKAEGSASPTAPGR